MSGPRLAHLLSTESMSLPWSGSPGAPRAKSAGRGLSGLVSGIFGSRGRSGRSTAFRPEGDFLESKTLLADILGWSGGTAGNTSSLITPANVGTLTQEYSDVLDGPAFAEPVTATVDITVGFSQGTQDVAFVATEQDSLYAINVATGQIVWQMGLLQAGESPLPEAATTTPLGGITGTPVIDPSTNTLYVVSTESRTSGANTYYSKTLHAVNMSTGTEQPGSPVLIADTGYNAKGKVVSVRGPSVAGKGAGSVHGRVQFYVNRQLQRVGLSLAGNTLIIGFGSYGGDLPPEHGWILAYDKTSLKMTGVFNDTPNGSDGGIWNDGNPIQADAEGYLYTETGNGTFDTKLTRGGLPKFGDYGDSVLKLQIAPGYKGPTGTGIRVVDYFTPDNQAVLDQTDGDLASSGVLILPDGAGGPSTPNLLLASNKKGTIFVLNRNSMGHYSRSSNRIVESLDGEITASFDTPAYFNNTIYYGGVRDVLRAFQLVNGQLQETAQGINALPYPGASPVVSSDGAQNGIVWVISSAKQLLAYDPTNLHLLWAGTIPSYSTFAIPTITDDGHVIVGAGNSLVGFGLSNS